MGRTNWFLSVTPHSSVMKGIAILGNELPIVLFMINITVVRRMRIFFAYEES